MLPNDNVSMSVGHPDCLQLDGAPSLHRAVSNQDVIKMCDGYLNVIIIIVIKNVKIRVTLS